MHQHVTSSGSQHRLLLSIVVNLIIPVVQLFGGLAAGSMAVVSDAIHNFSDCTGLIIAYIAHKTSQKGPSLRYSFGLRRVEILAAIVNTGILFGAAVFLVMESYSRFLHPEPVSGGMVIVLALVGIIGNGLAAWLLYRDSANNINIRGAFVHMMGDLLTSVAVLLCGIVLLFADVPWLDPLLSLLIVIFIVKSSWGILVEATHIVLEGTPRGVELMEIKDRLESIPGILNTHHLHVWSLGTESISFMGHVIIEDQPLSKTVRLRKEIDHVLHDEFDIDHVMIQFEAACHEDEDCGVLCPTFNHHETR
ncbi:cation diffusion facilitator family transporter [Desulfovibrio inopinatus]|uniref:cation diffusion facilitator family transporter n=1 Tax=Desulfovibrio inopinatus TaxID=102109 RepID=UPI0003F99F5A|nr:cation diffusion facilitator family transporter [Desulfovibrio inopinatus]